MKFAVIWSSIASRFDAFIPFASVATKATSATPIINAAAVAAVRPGLRIELRRASAPGSAADPAGGEPDDGGERPHELGRDHRDADEQQQHSARDREQPIGGAEVVGEHRPAEQDERERDHHERDVRREAREPRPFGSSAPSRTAAIGGTRVARIAGKSPAITVMSVPTSSETTIVRVAKTVSATGSPSPSARKSASSPFASASPRKSPTTDARKPITNASSSTDRST